jgi:hypothetical protein
MASHLIGNCSTWKNFTSSSATLLLPLLATVVDLLSPKPALLKITIKSKQKEDPSGEAFYRA